MWDKNQPRRRRGFLPKKVPESNAPGNRISSQSLNCQNDESI